MMKIILAGKEIELAEPAWGTVKKLTVLYNRMALAGGITTESMDYATLILSAATCMTVDEVDAMPITFTEMTDSLPKIAEFIGLINVQKESTAGELLGVDGTSSTSTS